MTTPKPATPVEPHVTTNKDSGRNGDDERAEPTTGVTGEETGKSPEGSIEASNGDEDGNGDKPDADAELRVITSPDGRVGSPVTEASEAAKDGRHWARPITAVIAIILGATVAALLFSTTADYAVTAGVAPRSRAWLVPLAVEGGALSAAVGWWAFRPRLAAVLGVSCVSLLVAVNTSHLLDRGSSVLAISLAAAPPVILLAAVELAAQTRRR